MKKNSLVSIILIFLSISSYQLSAYKIALCVVATGKYELYAQQLIASARNYFCVHDDVHYFVFTNAPDNSSHDVTYVFQERLGWPHDTLMRFGIYLKNRNLFTEFDYIYATDADMLFVNRVGREILSQRVATRHPGFLRQRGTYETNPASTAYVGPDEGKYYFAGGFYGGTRDEFLAMMQTLVDAIDSDLSQRFIALWHDESHLNRYFIDNPPTKILSPSYCYPESWNLPYKKKLLALDKNHNEMRK